VADREVQVYKDLDAVAEAAAKLFIQLAATQTSEDSPFNVALSGGSTPKALYRFLSSPEYKTQLDWSLINLFWGDERPVPPDHPDSNYKLAAEGLAEVPIERENIHRYLTETGTPAQVAAAYAEELRGYFHKGVGEFPSFDLILLGMGPDGHTASLFPGTAALHNSSDLVVANYVPKLAVERLTFTAPLINAARCVVFLVAGADKAAAVREVLEGAVNSDLYPSQLVAPQAGKLIFMLDEVAATGLTK